MGAALLLGRRCGDTGVVMLSGSFQPPRELRWSGVRAGMARGLRPGPARRSPGPGRRRRFPVPEAEPVAGAVPRAPESHPAKAGARAAAGPGPREQRERGRAAPEPHRRGRPRSAARGCGGTSGCRRGSGGTCSPPSLIGAFSSASASASRSWGPRCWTCAARPRAPSPRSPGCSSRSSSASCSAAASEGSSRGRKAPGKLNAPPVGGLSSPQPPRFPPGPGVGSTRGFASLPHSPAGFF